MQKETVLPLIVTCSKDTENVFKSFVTSYSGYIKDHIDNPIVVYDTTYFPMAAKHMEYIMDLGPRVVSEHKKEPECGEYESIQRGVWFALQRAVEESKPETKWIMFMEDDIIFSSAFIRRLTEIVDTNCYSNVGFISFYEPGGPGYYADPIDCERFYGTQCILFPMESIRILVNEVYHITRKYSPGYDIQWSRWLQHEKCKILYMASHAVSYVQHIGFFSRLHNGGTTHTSYGFLP
jgi:hypothetical protein